MFSVEQLVIANVKDIAWPNAVFDLMSTSRLSIDARGCGAACDEGRGGAAAESACIVTRHTHRHAYTRTTTIVPDGGCRVCTRHGARAGAFPRTSGRVSHGLVVTGRRNVLSAVTRGIDRTIVPWMSLWESTASRSGNCNPLIL